MKFKFLTLPIHSRLFNLLKIEIASKHVSHFIHKIKTGKSIGTNLGSRFFSVISIFFVVSLLFEQERREVRRLELNILPTKGIESWNPSTFPMCIGCKNSSGHILPSSLIFFNPIQQDYSNTLICRIPSFSFYISLFFFFECLLLVGTCSINCQFITHVFIFTTSLATIKFFQFVCSPIWWVLYFESSISNWRIKTRYRN